MAGSSIDSGANRDRTLLLVGRTGNGKSSTGNSIIGKKVFRSMFSSAGVTSACEIGSTVLAGGQTLNVIDTPGLCDVSLELENVGNEIWRFINMAKDGVHAVLVVLSVRSRFSQEEAATIKCLHTMLGSNMSNNMIVVFTGGDDLEGDDQTLDDYLGHNCPEPLKEILDKCGNRRVLFDNKTDDKMKKAKQLQELLSLVDVVVKKKKNNEGKSCTDLFEELKIASKLKEEMFKFKQRLEEEQAARMRAAASAQKESVDEIRKLRMHLERAERETEELKKLAKRGRKTEFVNLAVQVFCSITSLAASMVQPAIALFQAG